jgi:hypothetical protein
MSYSKEGQGVQLQAGGNVHVRLLFTDRSSTIPEKRTSDIRDYSLYQKNNYVFNNQYEASE